MPAPLGPRAPANALRLTAEAPARVADAATPAAAPETTFEPAPAVAPPLSPAHASTEPPTLKGRLEVRGEAVVLRGVGGALELVNSGSWCWGSDASAFHGATVTVRGWPDGAGKLVVEEFAPGSLEDFAHGRVELASDGRVGLRVRADKWVELAHPELAESLRPFAGTPERPGTGVILPGPVAATSTADGPRWSFGGNPEGYYLLTTLREAADGGFEAEVAHGRRLTLSATTTLRADFPDSRRFAFGRVRRDAGTEGRQFDASWVSPPTWVPVWTAPTGTPTRSDTSRALAGPFAQSPSGLVPFTPPRLPTSPPVVFRDRAVLQEVGDAAVYFIAGGAKLHVPTPTEFGALGLSAQSIRRVPDRVLSHVPDVPADGTLVRERGTAAVYVFDAGARRHIADPQRFAALGLVWANVIDVPQGSLGRFPVGPAA